MRLRELQQYCDPEWRAIQSHPFVIAMGQGRLSEDQLLYFIVQDALYLRDFYWVLAMAAGRFGESTPATILLRHAGTVFEVEKSLHDHIIQHFGRTPQVIFDIPRGIITKAYGDHLVRSAYTEPVTVLMAAVLPCYWTYQEIGAQFREQLPDHPLMREWLVTYDGSAYRQAVSEVVTLFEKMYIPEHEIPQVKMAFHASMDYERLFWEQAWQEGLLQLPTGT